MHSARQAFAAAPTASSHEGARKAALELEELLEANVETVRSGGGSALKPCAQRSAGLRGGPDGLFARGRSQGRARVGGARADFYRTAHAFRGASDKISRKIREKIAKKIRKITKF